MGDVSGTDVQSEWHALDFPVVVLLTGVEVSVVHLDAKTTRAELVSNLMGHGDGINLEVLANHRANDDLERGNLGRHDQAVLIAVHAHHGTEQPLRHPVGGLVAERLFGIEVFVGHVEGFGPLVAVVVT